MKRCSLAFSSALSGLALKSESVFEKCSDRLSPHNMDSPTLNTPRGRDEESEDDVVADVVVEDDHDDDLILPLDLSALREDEGSVDETCQPEELAHPGVVVSSGQVPKPGEVDLLLHIPAFEGVSLPPPMPPPVSGQNSDSFVTWQEEYVLDLIRPDPPGTVLMVANQIKILFRALSRDLLPHCDVGCRTYPKD